MEMLAVVKQPEYDNAAVQTSYERLPPRPESRAVTSRLDKPSLRSQAIQTSDQQKLVSSSTDDQPLEDKQSAHTESDDMSPQKRIDL